MNEFEKPSGESSNNASNEFEIENIDKEPENGQELSDRKNELKPDEFNQEEEKKEAEQLEKLRKEIAEKETDDELQEQKKAGKTTPEEMFKKYFQPKTQEEQDAHGPGMQKLVNSILEKRYFREFRKERADELFEGIVSLLGKAREGGNDIKTVVDLGCGQGEILRNIIDYLKEENPAVLGIGIDNKTRISRDMQDGNMVFMKGDALETGLEDDSVDFVNINYLLQALNEEMQKQALEEAKKIISENGHMIIMDVIKREGLEGKADTIKHNFLNSFAAYNIRTEEGWEKFLEDNGLEIEEKTEVGDRSIAFLVRVKRDNIAENSSGAVQEI